MMAEEEILHPQQPQRDKSEWPQKSGNSIQPFLRIILSVEEFQGLNLNETEFSFWYVFLRADCGLV